MRAPVLLTACLPLFLGLTPVRAGRACDSLPGVETAGFRADAREEDLAPGAAPANPHPREPLRKAVTVRFETRDGDRVGGKAVAFDGEAFELEGAVSESERKAKGPKSAEVAKDAGVTKNAGGARRVRWLEVAPDGLAALAGKILDEKQADDSALLGELLLAIGDEKNANRAFDRARKADPSLAARIDGAHARAARAAAEAEHAEFAARHQSMAAAIPRVEPGAAPWPMPSAEERARTVAEMKARGDEIARISGMNAIPVETRYFLLYGAAKPEAVRECARSLDAMYEKVLELFGIPAGLNLFHGKAVILLQPSEEKFRMVEAAAFNAMVPRGVVGLCHQVGPQVFVNIFWSDDQDAFDSTLLHETVHGIVHRYYSSARLPDWANEGLSEYIAAVSFKTSPVDRARRPQALEFIRAGGSVADVMRLSYQDGSWPGPNAIGYAVGYVVVELMIRQQPDAFGRWIRAVKAGKPWERALEEDFGHTVDEFGRIATEWYRSRK